MSLEDCLKTHQKCFMCGVENPHSLGLSFELLSDDVVSTRFSGSEILQGYSGYLHGGIISALLDCAMVHCLFHRNIKAVTTDLSVRFRKKIRFDAALEIKGELLASRHGLHKLRAEISSGGELLAEAEARFLDADDL